MGGLQKKGPVGPVGFGQNILGGQKERDKRVSSLFIQNWCFSCLKRVLSTYFCAKGSHPSKNMLIFGLSLKGGGVQPDWCIR